MTVKNTFVIQKFHDMFLYEVAKIVIKKEVEFSIELVSGLLRNHTG